LVAERYFQVKDLLAVTLKAEMPRLNDAGVDRADGHLVNLFPFHPVEIGDADDGRFPRRPPPRVVTGTVRRMEPYRLEPGMPLGTNPILFGDLALEQVDLGAVGGE